MVHYFNIHFEIFEKFTLRGDRSMEKADLEQKLKLAGRDKMEQILAKYRQKGKQP
jgi:hypothetical protein